MSFTFDIEAQAARCVISISGRFMEAGNNKVLLEKVAMNIKENHTNFLLDLEDMTLLNSEGINLLVRIVNMVNDNKGQIVFTNVPDQIGELLSVIKLNSVFIIKEDLKQGLEFLKA
ncbi:MAG: anti-anti-sigma factor [Flavobacteriales bacterium]|jgi:anti-anti-sigma factor